MGISAANDKSLSIAHAETRDSNRSKIELIVSALCISAAVCRKKMRNASLPSSAILGRSSLHPDKYSYYRIY
jgi:hypothetical protein